MDGGGGACVTRFTGGGGASGGFREITYGMSKVERIMLKFRPIAPKPMSAGSGGSSCSTAEHSDGGNRRRKRRYVRVNGNKKKDNTNGVSKKRRVSSSSSENSGGGDAAVTLALMPETPDRKENSPEMSSPGKNPDLNSSVITNRNKPILLSFNNYQQKARDGHVRFVTDHDTVMIASPSPSPPPQKSVVTSLVTMECVTDTWTNLGLGFITDQEKVTNMEMDTCPSFITDSRDTVVWTNKAYRKMTAGGGRGGGGSNETVMVVVKKVNRVTMPVAQPAFTCQVKVTWPGAEPGAPPLTITAPCDVGRLRSGGYAWRLDVNAALCLGRPAV